MASADELIDVLEVLTPQIQHYLQLVRDSRLQKNAKHILPQLDPLSKWDQIEPLCTPRAKLMTWYFDTFGVIGLAYFIVEIARFEAAEEAERNANSSFSHPFDPLDLDSLDEDDISLKYDRSWDLILNDSKHNACRNIIYYLSSLPAELTQAMIYGNLPSRMQDASFKRRVEGHVTPMDRQGTYGICIALDRVPVQSAQEDNVKNTDVGRGVTLKQMLEVHKTMSLYINVRDPTSDSISKEIDTAFSGCEKQTINLDYTCQRRYGSGSSRDDFGRHQEWLDFIESQYLSWARKQLGTANEHLLEVHLARCFVYVGLSKSVVSRMPNHWKHSSTINNTVGLLTATLEHLYPGMFSVVKSSFQIFKTVSKAHIGLDEKLSMLLTGAYPWDGGLNADYGGRSRGCKDNSAASFRRMKDSKSEIEVSGLIDRNFRDFIRKIDHSDSQMNAETAASQLRSDLFRNVNLNYRQAVTVGKNAKKSLAETKFTLLSEAIADFTLSKLLQKQSKRHSRLDDQGEA